MTVRAVDRRDLPLLERWQPTGASAVHETRVARVEEGASTYLVAFDGAGPVGSCEVRWDGPPAPEVSDGVPEVNGLQVWPQERQGSGVGSRLLDHVEALVAGAGHRGVGLGVDPANEGALRLYRRRGYLDTGTRYPDRYTVVDDDGVRRESADVVAWLVKPLP
ncbi:GNAT family N-acetyltransferase [Phycicoccus sp. CMS6Z-2]|nr:GNAT family N-acetyltransferase [Phycicoccus flavus]